MRLSNMFLSCDEHLTIRRAGFSDQAILQEICDAWIEKGFFEGDTLPSDYIEQCLTKGDLPPIANATLENYGLYVIEVQREVVGLFDLYEGYPESGVAWISLMLLRTESRAIGLGKIVIDRIVSECRLNKIESLALAVSMNNRVAFKFWVNLGFKEIINVYGDLKYPIIGLKMKL